MKKIFQLKLSTKNKITFFAILFFIFFSCITLFLVSRHDRNFRNFCNNFFVSELSGNTLNMHYTIACPENYGIDTYTPTLPSYSAEGRDNSLKELEQSIAVLQRINPEHLKPEDSYAYRLLLSYLQTQQKGSALYYYASPLSPSSGMQSQLPILLAEYTFRTKRDITDYLSLLDQTDTYFEGITNYLKEQSELGLFMPDYSVDKVISQCDTIMDSSLLESETHFLNTTFEERLNHLLEKGIITEEEKASYMVQNSRLLTTVMLPAYRKMGDELLLLKGSGNNQEGLSHYPKGKEYYLYLLRSNTGSGRDIEDIKTMLYENFSHNMTSLSSLLRNNPSLLTQNNASRHPFIYRKPSDMLNHLQQIMSSDYPALIQTADNTTPVCTIKSVSKNLEEYCSPAFYLTPPLDDIHENVIYINQKNNPTGVELYTTLAHEGYPGHLYQTVYSQLYFQNIKANPIRSLLSYGGYVEGWAMYVELESYDYAKTLMKNTAPDTDALYESYKLERQVQLCLYSLLDIAIHYEGAGYTQVHQILSTVGITNPETTRAIFEYIAEEPTNYLKYYLGYLEILELKREAQSLWGNAYSDYQFHQFYLENGPADFTNLSQQLNNYQNIP